MWKVGQNSPFFQMSAILKFDFQEIKKLRLFSEVNYLNYTKRTQVFMWQLHFHFTFYIKNNKKVPDIVYCKHIKTLYSIPAIYYIRYSVNFYRTWMLMLSLTVRTVIDGRGALYSNYNRKWNRTTGFPCH